MSNRILAFGSDLMIFERSGTYGNYVYKAVAGQTACGITEDANYLESNAKNLQGGKNFQKGIFSFSASVEIDVVDNIADPNTDEVSFEDLEDYQRAGTKPTFVIAHVENSGTEPAIDDTKRMYIFQALVNVPNAATAGEKRTASVALQGIGKYYISDSGVANLALPDDNEAAS